MTVEEFRLMIEKANAGGGRAVETAGNKDRRRRGGNGGAENGGNGGRTSGHKGRGEEGLQTRCLKWLKAEYPDVRYRVGLEGVWLPEAIAKRLKSMGMISKGLPDVEIYASRAVETARNEVAGTSAVETAGHKVGSPLFLELKDGKKGRQSEAQKEFQKYCDENGYAYHVVRDFEAFQTIVKEHLCYGK